MKYKLNVTIVYTETNIVIIEGWAQACREILNPDYEPTVTSGSDGKHSDSSGHYYNRALDFRSRDIPPELRRPLLERARAIYGNDYYAMLRPTHYHVQRNKNTF